MKIRHLIGASRHVMITTETHDMMVLIRDEFAKDGRISSAAKSMMLDAYEMREKVARQIKRIEIIEQAAKKLMLESMDDFVRAYIRAALWATNDESNESGGNPLDDNYSAEDIAPTALHSIIADCTQFQAKHADLLAQAYKRYSVHPDAPTVQHCAGHDFFLTRNRHGVGFWDRKELEADGLGEQLTEAAQAAGEVSFYVGDDGLIYV